MMVVISVMMIVAKALVVVAMVMVVVTMATLIIFDTSMTKPTMQRQASTWFPMLLTLDSQVETDICLGSATLRSEALALQ